MQDTTEHHSNLSISRLTGQVDGLDNFESLETARDLFEEFQKRVPTLEEAIKEAAFAKVKVEDLRKFTNDVKEERKIYLDRLGITDDEVGAIICYTLDGRHGEPYRDINKSLSYSRNRSTLLPMRKFIFLFLNGLRKLNIFKPNRGQELYRAIGGEKVPTEKSEAGGHQCYRKNKTITWWAFTSTTTDFNVLSEFFNKEKGSKNTIFIIGGEKTWGYDISPFSKLAEKEVVLEPETKVKVNGFIDSGDCLAVKVEFQERGKLALGDIITGRQEIVIAREHDDLATITKNVKVLTKIGKRKDYYSVFENTPLSPNTIITRNVRILESRDNNGENIFIGVVHSDVDHNEYENYFKCGWFFSCYDSTLCSGPPHRYKNKEYGPRRGDGEYVHTGDNVGVIMDTTKGELSFVLNGMNLGVAYERIPLDEPLSLCVLFKNEGDSIELDTFEAKENVDSSIPVPSNVMVRIACDSITLTWDKVSDASFYQVEVDGKNSGDATTTNIFTKKELLPETEHTFRVRTVRGSLVSEWSNIAKGKTFRTFSECAWKECPDDVDFERMYSVDNHRTATKMNDDEDYCTIIGNTPIPPNKVTSWSVKILKSKNNNGNDIYIGVAPSDINQNVNNINYNKCGWYFYCYDSSLYSGLPHNYRNKEYGPRKGNGQYVHTGDSVGVVMDTTNGGLSFILNNVNLGVAYCGIPLDKPLVPCIILKHEGDSVELDISEVKENVDSSIPVPSNFTTKSPTSSSITIAWDEISDASFYQVEADFLVQGLFKTNTFTKKGLTPETEHTFRVRAVRGTSVSEWSDTVKGKTLKMQGFSECEWKECPNNAIKKYTLSEKNPRIAKNIGDSIRGFFVNNNYCGIIGNTHIPPNTTTSWSIKILDSEEDNGDYIYIGVAPSDLNLNNDFNYNKCGWYLNCYNSTLCSGPPHNYIYKEYGQRKGNGEYVHTGVSVGVVVDTTKGDLSFVLGGVNQGAAYEKIPLDKPLVPCVFLKYSGDSVELDTSEVKENEVDSSIPVPSNITAINNDTWDTITLKWDEVSDASFYQVEADSLVQEMLKANTFTKRGLYPDTEHSFRVRTVKDNSVSEWSDVVKGKTLKAPDFSKCEWKKYPNREAEYYINAKKPRIAKNINAKSRSTIIGNTYIPFNTRTTWNIKIVKSFCKDGTGFYIGIAPFDINLDKLPSPTSCGWYFDCYDSALYSGPPHNYGGNAYGPRKGRNGQYVHDGDSIGVVMDTKKGDLSFALNGVNLGVAYEGIPVDKPLVPCITTGFKNDTVELII